MQLFIYLFIFYPYLHASPNILSLIITLIITASHHSSCHHSHRRNPRTTAARTPSSRNAPEIRSIPAAGQRIPASSIGTDSISKFQMNSSKKFHPATDPRIRVPVPTPRSEMRRNTDPPGLSRTAAVSHRFLYKKVRMGFHPKSV